MLCHLLSDTCYSAVGFWWADYRIGGTKHSSNCTSTLLTVWEVWIGSRDILENSFTTWRQKRILKNSRSASFFKIFNSPCYIASRLARSQLSRLVALGWGVNRIPRSCAEPGIPFAMESQILNQWNTNRETCFVQALRLRSQTRNEPKAPLTRR